MTHRSFAEELEAAAGRLTEMNLADVEALIRRAALRLRNTSEVRLDARTDVLIEEIMEESDLSRSDVIRGIIRDWMITTGRRSS